MPQLPVPFAALSMIAEVLGLGRTGFPTSLHGDERSLLSAEEGYREALGGSSSFDAYRVDVRTFWTHGGAHVLAVRQYNWSTSNAPTAAEATVIPSRL
jgi:hypothetical protein